MKKTARDWDIWFLGLTKHISTASKDPSTKVGAIIVRPDKSIVSTGYNGFPRGMEDRTEWYENRDEKYSRIIHAEVNALVQAKQSVEGCTLYTWPFCCCDRCAVFMIQAGISSIVSPSSPPKDWERWGESFYKARLYFLECGISYLEIPREEIA